MTKQKNQVVVWPGTLVGKEKAKEFEDFIFTKLGVKVKYLEEIKTAPDMKNGKPIEKTGGRNDVFFEITDEGKSFGKFCIQRLQYGMRWIEDVLDNEEGTSLYPERVREYRTW